MAHGSFPTGEHRTKSTIVVRAPKHRFANVPRKWLLGSMLATHIANGANMLFPSGERFFIRSVKRYVDRIDDAQLLADVRAFFGQEGRHATEHERLFETMRAQGLEIDGYLRFYEKATAAIETLTPAQLRLATTAACEHFTAILAEAALTDGDLGHAHPEMRALLLWHAVEEIEHRSVAFDVLQTIAPSYALRMAGLAMATTTLGGFWMMATAYLIAQEDRPIETIRRELRASRERRARQGGSVVKRVFSRGIRDYIRRDFHPAQKDLAGPVAKALAELGFAEPDARTHSHA